MMPARHRTRWRPSSPAGPRRAPGMSSGAAVSIASTQTPTGPPRRVDQYRIDCAMAVGEQGNEHARHAAIWTGFKVLNHSY